MTTKEFYKFRFNDCAYNGLRTASTVCLCAAQTRKTLEYLKAIGHLCIH